MLTTSITCLDDQTVAEKMRNIAARMQCDYALSEQAADEAVRTFQATDSVAEGLNAGIALVQHARRGQPPARAEDRAWMVADARRLLPSFQTDPTTFVTLCICSAVLAVLIAWGLAS